MTVYPPAQSQNAAHPTAGPPPQPTQNKTPASLPTVCRLSPTWACVHAVHEESPPYLFGSVKQCEGGWARRVICREEQGPPGVLYISMQLIPDLGRLGKGMEGWASSLGLVGFLFEPGLVRRIVEAS